MDQEVIIVGAFHEIIELAENCSYTIIGIFDNKHTGTYRGYPILCTDGEAIINAVLYSKYPLIVSPDLPETRKKLVKLYKESGFSFKQLISPKSTISKSATIGEGVSVQDGVNISADVRISDFARLNSCANVMHDSVIGEYTTIAPNAVILGRVSIGKECYIGSNSTILPEKKLGDKVTIGAGSVVTKDIGNNLVIIGNPGRELKR